MGKGLTGAARLAALQQRVEAACEAWSAEADGMARARGRKVFPHEPRRIYPRFMRR